jgi:hypothetical protein
MGMEIGMCCELELSFLPILMKGDSMRWYVTKDAIIVRPTKRKELKTKFLIPTTMKTRKRMGTCIRYMP